MLPQAEEDETPGKIARHLDLSRAPSILYGVKYVKYIDVSLAPLAPLAGKIARKFGVDIDELLALNDRFEGTLPLLTVTVHPSGALNFRTFLPMSYWTMSLCWSDVAPMRPGVATLTTTFSLLKGVLDR